MIAYIKGNIIKKTINSVIIESKGIGYEVFIPFNQLAKTTPEGTEIELFTYLHFREDILQLFGFASWEEKELFLLLINVSGIGPRAAITILSHGSINKIQRAIGLGDINFLTKIPGIGKKTAQRLIVELKDKMQLEDSSSEEIVDATAEIDGQGLISALSVLGYQEAEIKKIYPQLIKENPSADEKTLIKKALQLMAKI